MPNQPSNLAIAAQTLLPQIPRLRYQLSLDEGDRLSPVGIRIPDIQKMRRVSIALEPLSYHLGAASLALFDLLRDIRAVLDAKALSMKPGSLAELREAERNLLGYRLDSFLEAGRRAQNSICTCLCLLMPKANLPSSIADLITGLEKGKFSIPELTKQLLVEYWTRWGCLLRKYRDISQHHAIVGSVGKAKKLDDGSMAIVFCLPSNPFDREHRYDGSEVHVQSFVVDQFFALWELSYAFLSRIIDHSVDAVIMPAFEGALPLTRKATGSPQHCQMPLDPRDVEAKIEVARQEFETLYPSVPPRSVGPPPTPDC